MSQQPRPSKMKLLDALGLKLNLPIILLMFKGAVAPTIGLAIYQDARVAEHYSTIGYLIPIMSLLVVPIIPRARFISGLFITCFLTCLAAALSIFFMWISTKARKNTTHIDKEAMSHGPVPHTMVVPFNAAASANQAVWFFFLLWAYNTFRAFRPQYFLPLIVFGIFLNITATYGCILPTLEHVYSLIKRLLDTFFVGFGIAFAVHFLVLPVTTRDLVTMVLNEYLHHLKSILDAQRDFIKSLHTRDWSTRETSSGSETDNESSAGNKSSWPEAAAWRSATAEATEDQVKIHSQIRYVKREFTWSKLSAGDFVSIMKLMKNILVPVTGMETVVQLAHRVEKLGGWGSIEPGRTLPRSGTTTPDEMPIQDEQELWKNFFLNLSESLHDLWEAMLQGLDYAFFTLQITRKPAFFTKEELLARGTATTEGGSFATFLEQTIQDFLTAREEPLKEWCRLTGQDGVPGATSKNPLSQRHQSQLYLILNIEYCIVTTANAILDLVRFADLKVSDGTMAKKRLIVPTWKQLKKWGISLFTREDSNLDYQTYSYRSGTPTVHLGDALGVKKDPEHLPPVNLYERVTDKFRLIPKVVGSSESWFGFKVAAGTMFIAITCYLRNSQEFYIKQRIIWGSVMVSISMSQTAGSGLYGQFVRIFGTFLAMVFSYIDWYIVDGHTAGVIVFVGITMFLYHYLLVTKPDDPVIPMIGMITVMLIVGYELQVKQVGIPISVSNGQVFHPVYELAPYRLAAVLEGVGVASFLSYFPTVNTARAEMRKDLGKTEYLLGHYYSSTHKAVVLRLRDLGGDPADKSSPIRKVEKARNKLFAKQLILIQGMKNHLDFMRWEPTFGGKFPRETYERLLDQTRNILRFTAMIAFVTKTFKELPEDTHAHSIGATTLSNGSTWAKDFKEVMSTLEITSHGVTSLLAILSGAITSGRPVPPYLRTPDPYHLGEALEGVETDVLNTKHVCEPGYSAFAVMQLSTTMLAEDLAGLLEDTKLLVGEAEFNLDIVQEDYEKSVGTHLMPPTIRASKKEE